MTLETLSNYRKAKIELEDINNQLNECYVADSVQSGSKHPYSLHSVRVEGYKPDKRTNKLLFRRSSLESLCKEIEEFHDSIDDSELRQIVMWRYISKHKRSWQYIAMKLGYLSDHTPKRKLQKFLKYGGKGENQVL